MFELKNINKSFQLPTGESFQVLKDFSLSVNKGEVFGLIGLSGAGKSTALRTFNLLEAPDRGQVIFKGEEISKIKDKELRQVRQKIGMIFQHFNLLSNKTVAENVALSLKIAGWKSADIKPRVIECLELVRLQDKHDVYPNQLSGGQKQRVAIARSIANNPDLLLADEPTSALDPLTKNEVLECLLRLNKTLGLTVVISTHEMGLVKKLCHRVAIISEGQNLETLNVHDGQIQPTSSFGKALLETF